MRARQTAGQLWRGHTRIPGPLRGAGQSDQDHNENAPGAKAQPTGKDHQRRQVIEKDCDKIRTKPLNSSNIYRALFVYFLYFLELVPLKKYPSNNGPMSHFFSFLSFFSFFSFFSRFFLFIAVPVFGVGNVLMTVSINVLWASWKVHCAYLYTMSFQNTRDSNINEWNVACFNLQFNEIVDWKENKHGIFKKSTVRNYILSTLSSEEESRKRRSPRSWFNVKSCSEIFHLKTGRILLYLQTITTSMNFYYSVGVQGPVWRIISVKLVSFLPLVRHHTKVWLCTAKHFIW